MRPILRTALRRTGASVSAVAVLALAVAGAGLTWALSDGEASPDSAVIAAPAQRVGASDLDLVCPGPPRLPTAVTGDDIAYDEELGPGPDGVQTSLSAVIAGRDGAAPAPATLGLVGEEPAQVEAGTQTSLAADSDLTGPTLLQAEATGGVGALAQASVVARSDTGDLRGLAAAACQSPASSLWLVGGSTEVGASARLVMTNPGPTPAAVTITGWQAAEPYTPANPMLIPPGTTTTVLLETLSLSDQIATHISVDGGKVAAFIQDSRLDGLVPAGLDLVGAAAEPSTEVTIAPAAMSDDDDAGAVLRVVNPGEDEAHVQVHTLGPEGAEDLPGAQDLVIDPGTVQGLSLDGLEPGAYGFRLSADVPVTGAVELTRLGTPGEADPDVAPVDVAWVPSADPSGHLLLPVAAGEDDAVAATLVNPGEQTVTVQVTPISSDGERGEPDEVRIAPDSTAEANVPDGAITLDVRADRGGVLASSVFTADVEDGTLIAALGATPDADDESDIPVRLSTP